MCEYCKNVKTGDDYKPMVSEKIFWGCAGTITCDVVLVSYPDGEPAISLQYINELIPTDHGRAHNAKIRFCPMCGERLV